MKNSRFWLEVCKLLPLGARVGTNGETFVFAVAAIEKISQSPEN
jgi:uncharacterized membrane protein